MLGRLSYPELLSLTEEQLAGLGVTVGARRKILASVDRLQERPRLLASLGHRLEREGCDLREVRWNDKADMFSGCWPIAVFCAISFVNLSSLKCFFTACVAAGTV